MTKQAKPKQSSRRQRNANVISPFDRITAIYGLEYIKKRFEDTLVKAKDVTTNLALGDYHQITDNNLKLVGKPIVSASFTCKVKGDDKKMYLIVKEAHNPSLPQKRVLRALSSVLWHSRPKQKYRFLSGIRGHQWHSCQHMRS